MRGRRAVFQMRRSRIFRRAPARRRWHQNSQGQNRADPYGDGRSHTIRCYCVVRGARAGTQSRRPLRPTLGRCPVVAAAVHPDLSYVKILHNGEALYLAKAALNQVFSKGSYKVIEELTGNDMVGWTYDGPFDELPAEQKSGAVGAHRVILWEEVSAVEGTGIVHIAPGCGKDDLELGKEYGLPAVAPLSEFGVFVEGFSWLTGTHVYESAEPIIGSLKDTSNFGRCWMKFFFLT